MSELGGSEGRMSATSPGIAYNISKTAAKVGLDLRARRLLSGSCRS